MAVQKSTFITHYPVNQLVVDAVICFQLQTLPDAAVNIVDEIFYHVGNDLFDDNVIAARR